jgi:hypothetical protein
MKTTKRIDSPFEMKNKGISVYSPAMIPRLTTISGNFPLSEKYNISGISFVKSSSI